MRKLLILGTILVVVTTSLGLFIKYHPFQNQAKVGIRGGMSLRHIAERNNVPIDSLIPLLPPNRRNSIITTLKNLHIPIKDLKLDREIIKREVQKSQAKGFPISDVIKYILWSLWLFAAAFILKNRKKYLKYRVYWLLATLTLFGIILGAAPNPMEAFVKFHKLFKSIPGNPVIFVVLNLIIFTIFSILGAKMFCSWGCQLGALQESIYHIPIFKKLKQKWKLPFAASISVRITIYIVFLVLFFKLLNINQGGPGSILYHHLNSFKIYDFYDLALFTLLLIPVILVASLIIFRPFCHLLCPFGLYSWLLENIAIYKVKKVNQAECNSCGACETACPTDAMRAINKNKRKYFLPDCWSCGRCIVACKSNVLQYTSKTPKKIEIKNITQDS